MKPKNFLVYSREEKFIRSVVALWRSVGELPDATTGFWARELQRSAGDATATVPGELVRVERRRHAVLLQYDLLQERSVNTLFCLGTGRDTINRVFSWLDRPWPFKKLLPDTCVYKTLCSAVGVLYPTIERVSIEGEIIVLDGVEMPIMHCSGGMLAAGGVASENQFVRWFLPNDYKLVPWVKPVPGYFGNAKWQAIEFPAYF